MEQFVLIIIALINYRRLRPDILDDFDQPINNSYLADLDTLIRGNSPGNSGRIAEYIVLALVKVFQSFGDKFEGISSFAQQVFVREPPLLHFFAGFSDQYMRRRIKGQNHDTARKALPYIVVPETVQQDNDPDWVIVPHLEERLVQKLYLQNLYSDSILPAVEIKYMPVVVRCPAYLC